MSYGSSSGIDCFPSGEFHPDGEATRQAGLDVPVLSQQRESLGPQSVGMNPWSEKKLQKGG